MKKFDLGGVRSLEDVEAVRAELITIEDRIVDELTNEEFLDLVESQIDKRPRLMELVASFLDVPAALRLLDDQAFVTAVSVEVNRRYELVRLGPPPSRLNSTIEDHAAIAWLMLRVLDPDRR